MENFKLDLTQLTPVADADRIKGNWYVVADQIGDEHHASIRRYHSYGSDMNQGGNTNSQWNHWFAIPPNLFGFPKADLPDEFELKQGEWEYFSERLNGWNDVKHLVSKFRRTKPTLPELTIPSGTIQEQIEAMRKKIEELETKAGK